MAAQTPHYSLGIGEIVIIRDGGVISTVLGSCVAICIFSVDGSIGGMNHFVLPKPQAGGRHDEIYRYGEASCKALLDTVLEQSGVQKKNLRAKIVGGASILPSQGLSRDIGNQNIEAAKAALARLGIPVIGQDTGGPKGRQVYFYTETGKVRISMLDSESAAVPKLGIAQKPLALAPAIASKSSLPAVAPPVRPTPARGNPEPVLESEKSKVRVLIVDDSKTIQEFLKKIFAEDPEMEVVGVANHPGEAEALLATTAVDVMTLDIQMPVMDGVAFLEKIMPVKPMPVVMLTSMRMEDGDHVLKALELGAVDYIQKPKLADIVSAGPQICEKVKAAAEAQIRGHRKIEPAPVRSKSSHKGRSSSRGMPLIAIGASTGGTVALSDVLTALPSEIPPIVIVQHIPAGFSRAFAERLNTLCPFEVKEAEDGDEICSNRVLIAPGGKQMELVQKSGGRLIASITDAEPVNRHKPSVDYLFDSVAKLGAGKVLGIILTGMGSDGAKGMLQLKQSGCYTIAQDEKSCVVYGMPKEAVKLGAIDKSAPLDAIAGLIEKWIKDVAKSVA